MRGRPPDRPDRDPSRQPPDRSFPGTQRGDPNATINYGGPMRPGPRPANMMSHPLPGGNPNASSLARGPIVQGTMAQPAVSVAATPTQLLWTGNVGRLLLSEVASVAGDVIFGTGVVIWLLQIRGDFNLIAMLLLAFATPRVLVALFSGTFAGLRDVRTLLGVLGILRIGLATLFILMHFNTIIPIVILLAFGLSFASALRGALRRAAIAQGVAIKDRPALASGDQLAAGMLAVAGPALTTLIYILNGERIFAIAIGAAACYLFTLLGETRAEPLPPMVLYQRATEEDQVQSAWEDEAEDETDEPLDRQSRDVWELAAPPNAFAALRDVGAGTAIAGSTLHALISFVALAVLALIGGGFSLIQPFYVAIRLHQVPYILGLLFTATGLGAAIGSAIVVELRRGGRIFTILGLTISGGALIVLPRLSELQQAIAAVAIIGAANVFAIRGSQITLLRHFSAVEQRAVAAATQFWTALATLLGIIGAAVALSRLDFLNRKGILPPVGIHNLLIIGGVALLLMTVAALICLFLPNRVLDDDDEELDDLPGDEEEWATGESQRYSAAYSAEMSTYGQAYDESARYPSTYTGDLDDGYSRSYQTYDESAEYSRYDESYRDPRSRRYDD